VSNISEMLYQMLVIQMYTVFFTATNLTIL